MNSSLREKREENSPYPMVPLSEALHEIEKTLKEHEQKIDPDLEQPESLPLRGAAGRFLFRDIESEQPHPSFPASIVDGYAICIEDVVNYLEPYHPNAVPVVDLGTNDGKKLYPSLPLTATFQLLGLTFGCLSSPILAGQDDNPPLETQYPYSNKNSYEGENNSVLSCTYITTGAAVPCFYDAVIPTEYCIFSPEESIIEITKPISTFVGQNIRTKGSDISSGLTILKQGTKLDAVSIALLATLGMTRVDVRRKISFALLSTGDELIPIPTGDEAAVALTGSKIYDSNELLLSTLLEKEGVTCEKRYLLPDNPTAITTIFQSLQNARSGVDVVICTGGVSMGKSDYIKPYLEKNGTILFGRLNLKPGKPTTVGILPRVCVGVTDHSPLTPLIVFALPGNPVSAWVTYHLLVQPTLKYLQHRLLQSKTSETQQGVSPLCLHGFLPVQVPVVLSSAITPDALRPDYHRCIIFEVQEEAALSSRDQETLIALSAKKNLPAKTGGEVTLKKWPALGCTYLGAISTGNQISSRLQSCISANGLFCVPPACDFKTSPGFLPGDEITAFLLDTPYADLSAVMDIARVALTSPTAPHPSTSPTAPHPSTSPTAPRPSTSPTAPHEILTNKAQPPLPPPPPLTSSPPLPLHASPKHTLPRQDNHTLTPRQSIYTVGILTISDSCHHHGVEDTSGPTAATTLNGISAMKFDIILKECVPDQILAIRRCVLRWARQKSPPVLIILTGGTGLSKRDVTPSAIQPILTARLPGLEHLMMREGLNKTLLACLSHLTAGVLEHSLIVSLPGSPKAVTECLLAIIPVLMHAMDIMLSVS
ncbi:MoeA N-terminal region (domain I and II) domain-containing protein [Cardiosporidium cionae]|uniref:MoeA N-terminal region (Domain I and II) domain-containing protein n=1 Tax=Cardiosporidium cionae TaxID=476202 RepID=A0ABQ7JB57_9APIC|nr:MoeA N-terminal region (domain I and II) domain-containing protein [Cardiosporidium cionae]|eukprot:KAF8821193.1 MoeA N-terminal region (domain I and II) domain-containing protein [Cardiosporidium cionae]